MNYHVIGQMNDGSQLEGIITDMSDDEVEMLVPEDVYDREPNRQFGYGYDYNGYDYYNGYDDYYGRRRYRRYNRRRFPFYFFRTLFRYPFYF